MFDSFKKFKRIEKELSDISEKITNLNSSFLEMNWKIARLVNDFDKIFSYMVDSEHVLSELFGFVDSEKLFYLELKDGTIINEAELLVEDAYFIKIRYKKSGTLDNKRVCQAFIEDINKNEIAKFSRIKDKQTFAVVEIEDSGA